MKKFIPSNLKSIRFQNLTSRAKFREISSFVSTFRDSLQKLPMRETVRFKELNVKWSAGYVKNLVDSHANGLADFGFGLNDTVALWMKESPEKHTTLLACLQLGIKVADVDPQITDISKIRQFLKISNCRALFFDPVTESSENLLLLRKAIPELYYYDDSRGQFFHSKHFPALKYFIHTGYHAETGCLIYKTFFLRHPQVSEVENVIKTLSDETPAYFQISNGPDSNVVVSDVVNHGQLLNHPSLYFAKNIIDRKYFECC